MKQEQQDRNELQPLAEAQRLLGERLWDTERALWAQGEKVVIFFNPCPTENANRWDVPVTLRVLEGSTGNLEGVSVVLSGLGPNDEIRTYRERLNRHGLAVFRGVEKGSYRPALIPPTSTILSTQRRVAELLADLRRVVGRSFDWQTDGLAGVSLAANDPRNKEQIYLNSDKALKVTLQPDAGKILLRFQASDIIWTQGIIPFTWVALSAEEDMVSALIDVLVDEQAKSSDRIAAALKLGDIGGAEAVAKLEEMSNTCDSDVREAVEQALCRFEARTRFFTVLAWDEDFFGDYVAEVDLGDEPKRHELSLPERPLDLAELSPSMIPILLKSIKCALTKTHDLRAWRRLLEHQHVHPRILSLIEEETNPA
jgi:hypothetical protein